MRKQGTRGFKKKRKRDKQSRCRYSISITRKLITVKQGKDHHRVCQSVLTFSFPVCSFRLTSLLSLSVKERVLNLHLGKPLTEYVFIRYPVCIFGKV